MKKLLLFVAAMLTTTAIYADPSSAPTAPTYLSDQVKAVYSATYDADCGFGEWGSGTAYTQETYGKKFVTGSLGYFGLTFEGLNCSKMESLHLDLYTEDSDFSVGIVPIHGGAEVRVTKTATAGSWNSIDIALSEFSGVTDWTNVYQIKFDQCASKTFWLNNIYFYTTEEPEEDTEAPTNLSADYDEVSYFSATLIGKADDNSGTVILKAFIQGVEVASKTATSGVDTKFTVSGLSAGTAYEVEVQALDEAGNVCEDTESVNITTEEAPAPAPAPAWDANKVRSLYSDAYTQAKAWNIGSWGQSTVVEEGKLSDTDKALYCSNSNYLGWEFQNGALDCSETDSIHFDVWVEYGGGSIKFTPIWKDGEATGEYLESKDLNAGWNQISLALDDFMDINKATIFQIKWADMPTECFIDNVYFFGDNVVTSAEENDANVKPVIFKTIENGNIIIVTPAGKFNMIGKPIR